MVWLQTWAHMNADRVLADGGYPLLNEMLRVADTTGSIRMPDIAAKNRFLLIRAEPSHPDPVAGQPADRVVAAA